MAVETRRMLLSVVVRSAWRSGSADQIWNPFKGELCLIAKSTQVFVLYKNILTKFLRKLGKLAVDSSCVQPLSLHQW